MKFRPGEWRKVPTLHMLSLFMYIPSNGLSYSVAGVSVGRIIGSSGKHIGSVCKVFFVSTQRVLFCGSPNFHFVVFQLYLVGGSFGLREFAQIRYDVHKLHGKVVEMVFFTFPFSLILHMCCLLEGCKDKQTVGIGHLPLTAVPWGVPCSSEALGQ